jgi:glycosyltransferase involved in cell wall biosynthesis
MGDELSVLILGWEFPPKSTGGLGTHTYNLVKNLIKKGINVNLALPQKDVERIPGVNYIILPDALLPYSGFRLYEDVIKSVNEYNKAVYTLAKYKFDLIHTMDWLTAGAGIRLKLLTKKPLLVAMHSLEWDRTAGKPWKYIEEKEREAVHSADLVVTVSERMKEEIVKFYNVLPEKIRVIYNGININEFVKGEKKKRYVLYLGRLTPQKGVDHLIRAFSIVTKYVPDLILLIAGEGPDMNYLIKLTIDLNLADKVYFLGRVPDEELKQLYADASAFVMPSVSEPFGITALESIASKTPTIITKQSGVSEVIDHTIKVDFWDEQKIADSIIALTQYPAIAKVMSENALAQVARLSWSSVADEYIKVYRELIGK